MTPVFSRSPASLAREANAALDAERLQMRVYRRAFRAALALTPHAGAPHALAAIDAYVAGISAYDALAMAWADVTLFERSHPDIETLRLGLSWTETAVDDLFRAAMAIEAGDA